MGDRVECILEVHKVYIEWLLVLHALCLSRQSGKREAKGKDKNRYKKKLKAEVQRKLRVDKQQQLESMCVELEAVNSKGNSKQLFHVHLISQER